MSSDPFAIFKVKKFLKMLVRNLIIIIYQISNMCDRNNLCAQLCFINFKSFGKFK